MADSCFQEASIVLKVICKVVVVALNLKELLVEKPLGKNGKREVKKCMVKLAMVLVRASYINARGIVEGGITYSKY